MCAELCYVQLKEIIGSFLKLELSILSGKKHTDTASFPPLPKDRRVIQRGIFSKALTFEILVSKMMWS